MSNRVPGQHFDALVGHRDRRPVFRLLAWRPGSVRLDLLAVLVLVAAGLAACESGEGFRGTSATGPSESGGIVVESTTLRSVKDCDRAGCFSSCDVRGTVRNDTATDRKVTLTFTAFDKDGRDLNTASVLCLTAVCGPAVANGGEFVVPARGRSTYHADLLAFSDCGPVDRLEITQLKSEPVA